MRYIYSKKIKARNPVTGEFEGINAFAAESTEEYLARIQQKGEDTLSSVEEQIVKKGNETLDSIPDDYTALHNNKFDKANVVQTTGDAKEKVMSQKAVTESISDLFAPSKISWSIGGLNGSTGEANTYKNRIRSGDIVVSEFAHASIGNDAYYFGVYLYNFDKDYLGSLTNLKYITRDTILKEYPTASALRVVMFKVDNSDFELEIDVAASEFGVYTSRVTKNSKVVNNIAYCPLFLYGALTTSGLNSGNAKNRGRSNIAKISENTSIIVSSGHAVYIYYFDENETYIANSAKWLNGEIKLDDIKPEGAQSIRIAVKKNDDTDFSEEELTNSNLVLVCGKNDTIKQVVDNEIKGIRASLGIVNVSWERGSIFGATGQNIASPSRCRSAYIEYRTNLQFTVVKGYAAYVHMYADGVYLGGSKRWLTGSVSVKDFYFEGADSFRIVARKEDNAVIELEEVPYFSEKVFVHTNDNFLFNVSLFATDEQNYNLPVLELDGNVSEMTKDNAVELEYVYGDLSGTCTCKWQGSSSVRLGYPKRNYTIKFDNGFEAKTGWGTQKKYCMKANWIDPSAARNVVNALLWGQIVKTRASADTKLKTSPNYGAIDGFPIIIRINGKFVGLYTFNIPKDGWMMSMGEGNNEYLVCSESNSVKACQFEDLCTMDETDFSIEYKPDGVEDATIVSSFNTLLQTAINAKENWETELAPYMDIDSVFDYFIFVNCIGGIDNLGKNILYGTYDGTKWFMSAYDLDSTYGSGTYGTEWHPVVNDRNQFGDAGDRHRLAHLMFKYSPARLKARYKELRSTVLSDENVWFMFTNFVNQIPRGLYNKDAEKWVTMPATSTANISTYMDYYRMHCAYLDREIEALSDK